MGTLLAKVLVGIFNLRDIPVFRQPFSIQIRRII